MSDDYNNEQIEVETQNINTDTIVPVVEEKSNQKKEIISFVKMTLKWVLIFCIIQILFKVFLINAYVPSSSMEPSLYPGDLLIGSRVSLWGNGTAKPGDIVVFYNHEEGIHLVKRVIGIAGDTIEFKDNEVYRNGEKLDEPYIMSGCITTSGLLNNNIVEVPEDCYFVMGDNRENSKDSRYLQGTFIHKNDMRAIIWFRYWPITSIKSLVN